MYLFQMNAKWSQTSKSAGSVGSVDGSKAISDATWHSVVKNNNRPSPKLPLINGWYEMKNMAGVLLSYQL